MDMKHHLFHLEACKQISRLSSSQGEFAKNVVPPWYFPKKFALFTLCSGVFTF
jgi:hypothetical protein